MQTIIKHWYIIKVLAPKTEEFLGKILWGTVVSDETSRFTVGGYMSSSVITDINLDLQLVVTQSNSEYLLEGNDFSVYFPEVKLLD